MDIIQRHKSNEATLHSNGFQALESNDVMMSNYDAELYRNGHYFIMIKMIIMIKMRKSLSTRKHLNIFQLTQFQH